MFPTSKYICNMMYLYIIYIYLCLIYSIYQPMLICYLSTALSIYNNLKFVHYQQYFHYTITSKKVCVCLYIYIS